MVLLDNIFLIGPIGAGKSTIGKQLANELGLVFYDSDKEIEKKYKVSVDWIFDIEGEFGFRSKEHRVISELINYNGIILATGGGSVLLPENRKLLKSHGKIIYLKTSIAYQLERVSRDTKRSLLKKNKEYQIKKLMKEREPFYIDIADFIVNTDENTIKNIVNKIVNIFVGNKNNF